MPNDWSLPKDSILSECDMADRILMIRGISFELFYLGMLEFFEKKGDIFGIGWAKFHLYVPLLHFFDESALDEGENKQQVKKYKHLANLNIFKSKTINNFNELQTVETKGKEALKWRIWWIRLNLYVITLCNCNLQQRSARFRTIRIWIRLLALSPLFWDTY